jgi:methylenetetrahydrofolate reductase (NADPH)
MSTEQEAKTSQEPGSAARRTIREALQQGEFVVTCEFVPGRGKEGPAVDAALAFARDVKKSGISVHAVSLTDNPSGNPAILPDVLGAEILQEGLDVLVHFSCRDMNRNAMESRAMALARRGVRNLLVVTGDYTEGGYQGRAAPVFDLDAVQAIRYLKAMNAGLPVPGSKPGTTSALPKTDFLIAAAVSPFKLTEAELLPQYFKMERKIAAGADLIIPQLGYDMRKFLEIKRYLAARGLKTPVFGNVYVLSYPAGKAMAANKIPGCVVSDELLKTLEAESKAEDKGKAARLERAAKMVAAFKGMGFNGVHIGGFNLKAADFATILRRAAELAPVWESCVTDVQFGRPGEFYAFPPPSRYAKTPADPDPATQVGRCGKPLSYAFSRIMHDMMFDEKSLLYRAMKSYYRTTAGWRTWSRMTHSFEWMIKRMIFECRDCGDCGLVDLAYCCPMSQCAKNQRNGPCGGGRDGMCEVYPDEKPCVWTLVYRRRKSVGELDAMRTGYVPPCKAELQYTSGWANYYLGRDHTAPESAALQAGAAH